MLHTLRSDALTSADGGFELRLGLPWIRSMPLSSVSELTLWVDASVVPAGDLGVVLGSRRIPAAALQQEGGWWFVQDRLVLAAPRRLEPGRHDVAVEFQLLVPYLQAGPGKPLVLPFRMASALELDGREFGGGALPDAARDVA